VCILLFILDRLVRSKYFPPKLKMSAGRIGHLHADIEALSSALV